MSLADHDSTHVKEKVTRITKLEEKTSKNGNDYVLVTDVNGDSFFAWSDGWQQHLLENEDKYKNTTVRINYEAVDPPFYCTLRYVYPVAWEEEKPENNNFEVSFGMTEDDDDVLKTSDVSREERIVNQASMKFAAKMLDHRLEDGEVYDDDTLAEELNKWMSKFKRGAVTGEIE